MKILFHATNCSFQNVSGGMQVRVRKMQSLLSDKGIQVDFFNPSTTKLKDYDILHLFTLSTESAGLVRFAKSAGIKVVLSSVVSIIKSSWVIDVLNKYYPLMNEWKTKRAILNDCDIIIVETPAEAEFIRRKYGIHEKRLVVIPNGMDETCPGGDDIYTVIGRRNKFAIQVGRFDENKNQLNMIKALRGAAYDVVFFGGAGLNGSTDYYNACVEAAKGYSNIHLLGWVESGSPLINSAYHNAHAVLLPSHHETFGLVATEGAAAGAHVCISNTLAINGFNVFKKEHTYNPDDIREIRQVIDHVMATPKDNALKERAKEVFNWEKIVAEHINIYNSL